MGIGIIFPHLYFIILKWFAQIVIGFHITLLYQVSINQVNMSKKPTKCTKELTEMAARYVKEGFTYAQLAAALNISEDTLYLWFRRAKQEQKEPYLTFYVSVKSAEAELLSECLQAVKASMKTGDARSAFFLLERRFADSYGKKESVQVDQRTQALNVNVNTEMTVQERRESIAGLLAKLAPKSSLLFPE